jgi:murein DD-endopeptidase MepM/ murein hydrolase activator NlpD
MLGLGQPTLRRGRWTIVAALIAAGSLLIGSPALGGPKDDKRRVDKQLAQANAALESATARARQAGAAYAQANQQLPGAQRAVEQSKGEVAAAQVQANEAERIAERARAELAAAQSKLDATEQQVAAARDRLNGFVRATYQGGPTLAASAMLGVRSPDQLIAGLNYLDSLAGSERRALDQVMRSRHTAAEQRAGVAERKRLADEAEGRARAALDSARSAEAAAELARELVVQLVDKRKSALQVAQQEKAANARQYAALQAESRRIAAALREAARRARAGATRPRPSIGQPVGDGELRRPVVGWKSSDFGWRYDPYYRVWQLHAGTDFAAPGGAPIWAAAGGVVVRAGWNGGYGRYTCIYHHDLSDGSGLSTCYAHQARINVSVGEGVGAGEVIGRVGTTGASTGNHLHFEVRIDGEPVNPTRWL